jgi:hypothetical protein
MIQEGFVVFIAALLHFPALLLLEIEDGPEV